MKKYLLLLLVILIIVAFIKKCNTDTHYGTSGSSSSSTLKPTKEEAYYYSKKFVLEVLKAPTTAVFPIYGQDNIEVTPILNDKDCFEVKAWVTSQNAFGVPLKSPYIMQLRSQPGQWSCIYFIFDGERIK